jgi:hypothetical protein
VLIDGCLDDSYAADMSAPRLVPDFVAWLNGKVEEFGASPEATALGRSGAQLPKKFYDELFPLALFIEHEFAAMPEAVVTPNLNNDNFDAMISFRGLADTLYIEITRAIDGYDQPLRLEVLTSKGSVSFTGPIVRVDGRRGTPGRVVEIQDESIDGDLRLKKDLCLIKHAVRAKAHKVYGKHHLLLLVVDDSIVFCTEGEHRVLHALIAERLLSADLDSVRLVVQGITGKLVRSYQLPRYTGCEASSQQLPGSIDGVTSRV